MSDCRCQDFCDDEFVMCIDGRLYGQCEYYDEETGYGCGGVCEYYDDCGCKCHTAAT